MPPICFQLATKEHNEHKEFFAIFAYFRGNFLSLRINVPLQSPRKAIMPPGWNGTDKPASRSFAEKKYLLPGAQIGKKRRSSAGFPNSLNDKHLRRHPPSEGGELRLRRSNNGRSRKSVRRKELASICIFFSIHVLT
jgi:hypothetical protein